MTGQDGFLPSRAECPNHAPSYISNIGYNHVTIEGLTDRDIAFIWVPVSPNGDYSWPAYDNDYRHWRSYCSGEARYWRAGPGTWDMDMRGDGISLTRQAVGVSCITLPSSMPSDPSLNPWLAMEGILAFAWGGTKWFTSDAAKRLLGGGTSMPGGKVRRGMHSSLTGDVYVQPPSRDVFPTRITMNGTEFVGADGAGI